jgi:hypothetical protein
MEGTKYKQRLVAVVAACTFLYTCTLLYIYTSLYTCIPLYTCTFTNSCGKKIHLLLSAIRKRLPSSLAAVYCSIHNFDTERTFGYPLFDAQKQVLRGGGGRWAKQPGRSRRKIKTDVVRKFAGVL